MLFSGSCTLTSEFTDQSWKLILVDEVHVDHVVVYNRRDCCSDRIDGVKVRFLSFCWKPSTIYNAHTVIQLYLYKSTLIRSPPFISPAQCVYLLAFCNLVVPLQHTICICIGAFRGLGLVPTFATSH